MVSGKEFGVAVYKTGADDSFDYFTVRFKWGKMELAARGDSSQNVAWRVSQKYLKKVCEHPQTYIDNPARLDVDWLVSKVPGALPSVPSFSRAFKAYRQAERHSTPIKGGSPTFV